MLVPIEFVEKQITSGWFEIEPKEPDEPLLVQLQAFLATRPKIIRIVSMAITENTVGFLVPVHTRKLLMIYETADL